MKTTLKLKCSILFAALLLFSCLSYSQENYFPGFIIKNSGDTLKGFVKYKNWVINPKAIDFKTTTSSEPIRYIPTDIKEFGVKDEIYVSGIVEVENTTFVDSKLDYDSKLKISVDTIFLQTLFRGRRALYYYMNNTARENFYINNENGFKLLVAKNYLLRQGTTSIVMTRKDYVGQLNLFFSDCPALQPKIEKTSYAKRDLIRLFQDYSICFSSETGFQKKADKIQIQIGALAGASLTKLKFYISNPDYKYLKNTNFKLSPNFSGGLFFDIIMPRNQGKFSIYNELLFTMYKTDGQYEFIEYDDTRNKFTTEFSYSYLKINNLLRYRFLLDNISLFINAGISDGIRLSEKQLLKKEVTTYYSGTNTTLSERPPYEHTRKFGQGLLVGGGIKVKNISFEARLEKAAGMINSPGVRGKETGYYFLIGYRFK